jgi:hypothetical protein
VFLRDLSSQETARQHCAARIQMLLKNGCQVWRQPDNIVQLGYRCYLRIVVKKETAKQHSSARIQMLLKNCCQEGDS